MPKKFNKKDKPDVHKDLKGFEIKINSFGEMETTHTIDNLNKFLNENNKEEVEKKEEDE